tara:strand:- start:2378 stop:3307 length:930 start_codon:yes stop_codon:yes gene_type:complete
MATHYYRYTYSNLAGDETGPSKQSSMSDSGTGVDINIDNVPRNELLNIAKRSVYRSSVTTDSSTPATSTYKKVVDVTGNEYKNITDPIDSITSNAAMPTATNYIGVSSALLSIVSPGTINDSSATISECPTSYYRAVILFASIRLIQNKLTSYWVDTDVDNAIGAIKTSIARVQSEIFDTTKNYDTTNKYFKEVSDALDKAKALVDETSMGGDTEPESAQFHLKEEDPELVQSTLSVASQELNRANTWLAQYSSMGSQFLAEAQAHIQEVQSRMGKSAQEYQWLQTQLGMCKQEYMDFFGTGVAPTNET